MRTKRCPWCAKKIDLKYDQIIKPRTTLGSRYTRFRRCQYCKHFYGQRLSEKWIVLYILIAFSSMLFLGMLFQKLAYYAVFPLAVITVAWICLRPIQRMDENEHPLPLNMPVLTATIVPVPPSKKIKKNTLYFLSNDFDKHSSFHTVSPIFIHTVNYKIREITFSFLYHHPLNQEYFEHTSIALYDSKMLLTAQITNTR